MPSRPAYPRLGVVVPAAGVVVPDVVVPEVVVPEVVVVEVVVPGRAWSSVVVDGAVEVMPVDGSTVCGWPTDAAAVSSAVVVTNVR